MSGLLKGIGKVFKKVGKVALKVLPYAAAAAAVVFTGGAALGVLPSFAGAIGSVVGGLGLSTGLTGAITGAITNAGFGAAGGLLLGGKKGMKTGFLGGLVTGGVMGAVSPGLYGIDKAASAGAGSAAKDIGSVALKGEGGLLQSQGLSESLRNASLPAPKLAPMGQLLDKLPAVPDLVSSGGTKAAGGVLGFLNSNPTLASQLLGGVSQAFAPNEYSQMAKAKVTEQQQEAYLAYGGGDANGKKKGGYVPGVYSGHADPLGRGAYGAPPMLAAASHYQPRSTRWAWDPATSSIVEMGA
jgi:hypothetical protein